MIEIIFCDSADKNVISLNTLPDERLMLDKEKDVGKIIAIMNSSEFLIGGKGYIVVSKCFSVEGSKIFITVKASH